MVGVEGGGGFGWVVVYADSKDGCLFRNSVHDPWVFTRLNLWVSD